MSKIELLDCTLRDGAYITDGNFGNSTIKGIIENLTSSKIEMIEVGWLKNIEHDKDSSYFSMVNDISDYLPNSKNDNTEYLVMMDFGRYDITKLPENNGKAISAIRLVFPKEKFVEAIEYSKYIKNKGYKLYLQAANTQSYSDIELIKLAEKTNEVMPEAISIVDTFGVMYHNDLKRIFMVLNNNLDKRIKIGFHSHNNLQLSFALSIEFVKLAQDNNRNAIVDSSLAGMGRGAGNTPTELITNWLNFAQDKDYDLNTIMYTIDIYMQKFISNYKWGYSIPFCIAGQLGSHVNNIDYLIKNHKTAYKDMKIILEYLPKDERKLYNYDKLEEAYISYQDKEIDDKKDLYLLSEIFNNKKVLLLVPGTTLNSEKDKILKYIKINNPIKIGINAISDNYDYDYFFFTNKIRYNYAKEKNILIFEKIPHIITSNITTQKKNNEFIINYNQLIKRGWKYFDNSTIMILRLLSKYNIQNIAIAGFDGYKGLHTDDYTDSILQTDKTDKEINQMNEDIKNMLVDFVIKNQYSSKIEFITPSQFSSCINVESKEAEAICQI